MSRSRHSISNFRFSIQRRILTLLMHVVRTNPAAVIFGVPDSEENSLWAAIFLARHYTGRVILLCSNKERTEHYLNLLNATEFVNNNSILVQPRRPFNTVSGFLRAELVLYTHGLLGAPEPAGNRFHVNLWHGSGPKITLPDSLAKRKVGADAICGSSSAWTQAVKHGLHMPASASVLQGGPRLASLKLAPPLPRATVWERLGLDPCAKTVIWVPTYRQSQKVGVSDGLSVLAEARGAQIESRDAMIASAREKAIQLVVKPHPLDSENSAFSGIPVIKTDAIWDAGVSLYQFLALVDGLISDYSSIWVDCLGQGYPIGLFCPDLAEYVASRGLAEPTLDSVGRELLLNSETRIGQFFDEVATGSGPFVDAAQDLAGKIGFRCPDDIETVFIDELRTAIRDSGSRSVIADRLN